MPHSRSKIFAEDYLQIIVFGTISHFWCSPEMTSKYREIPLVQILKNESKEEKIIYISKNRNIAPVFQLVSIRMLHKHFSF